MDVSRQVLIQWSGLPVSLATWEDVKALKQRLGNKQLLFQGGEGVITDGYTATEDGAATVAGPATGQGVTAAEYGPHGSKRPAQPSGPYVGLDWQ